MIVKQSVRKRDCVPAKEREREMRGFKTKDNAQLAKRTHAHTHKRERETEI